MITPANVLFQRRVGFVTAPAIRPFWNNLKVHLTFNSNSPLTSQPNCWECDCECQTRHLIGTRGGRSQILIDKLSPVGGVYIVGRQPLWPDSPQGDRVVVKVSMHWYILEEVKMLRIYTFDEWINTIICTLRSFSFTQYLVKCFKIEPTKVWRFWAVSRKRGNSTNLNRGVSWQLKSQLCCSQSQER